MAGLISPPNPLQWNQFCAMRNFLRLFLTGILIVSVNILSITITCFLPSYGDDGHAHTFFHLFEAADAHAAHSDTHSNTHSENHKNCSLDSNASMTMLAAAAACDLCVGQENFSIKNNDVTTRISLEKPLALYTISLSPPPEPPELG
jgi:hypothetical protein